MHGQIMFSCMKVLASRHTLHMPHIAAVQGVLCTSHQLAWILPYFVYMVLEDLCTISV